MQINYKIGTFTVQVNSEFPFLGTETAELFRVDEPGKLVCTCSVVDDLPSQLPNKIYSEDRMDIYAIERGGMERVLLTQNPYLRPYLSATEHACGRRMELRYHAAELAWSSHISCFWKAMNLRHGLLRAGNLLLHSSYICDHGGAILFTAPKGVGKLTQAELWAKYRGAKIVNGGRTVLGLENDVSMAYGVPLSGSSHICQNQSHRIKAIAVISQGEESYATRLQGPRALAAVGKNLAIDGWREGEYAWALSILSAIIDTIPVYDLKCTPDESAVVALERAMIEK